MSSSFEKLNLERRDEYRKDPGEEALVAEINDALLPMENASYRDIELAYPYIFVFGLPRSGTTLITQLLAHCLDTGFVNNFAARFWKVPVTGVRLAKAMKMGEGSRDFESRFGATNSLEDIHEFGYFWRHWLQISNFEDIGMALSNPDRVDWEGLYRVLANMQSEFDRPIVMKNLLGTYYLPTLCNRFRKVVLVYIERDELDVAVSILNARRKHYSDPNKWWSYVPPGYKQIMGLDYWQQIAGQVVLLKDFFEKQIAHTDVADNVVRIGYSELIAAPGAALQKVVDHVGQKFDISLKNRQDVPALAVREHKQATDERGKFQKLIAERRRINGDTSA